MRKIFSLFAALTLCAGLWAIDNVPYIDANGQPQTANDVTEITNATSQDWWSEGWYVVKGSDVTLSKGAFCDRAVNLILADGAKLTVTGEDGPGIDVSDQYHSLTIYGQANQSGQLIANGDDKAAGIGGGDSRRGYNITINGGTVIANGGDSGAGIGGGLSNYGINITINGGKVIATGGHGAAGIGGGLFSWGEKITINGGIVTAIGGEGTFDGIGSGGAGPASHDIFVATSLVVKADNNNNPPTTVRAATRTATTDIAKYLADKRYVTVEPKPVPHNGDQFVDETSGLKFEVTAVGEANTVKVIKNNYTGTSYTVPDTVKYLDVDFAVTEIGTRAFDNCESLQSITIPDGVITIGTYAFEGCSALQSITIPAGVTEIQTGAFAASGLQTITIPAGVTEIQTGAFYECTGLTSVTFLGNACQDAIGGHAFDGVGDPDPALLTLPDNWTGSKPDEDGSWYGGKFNLSEDPTKKSVITYTASEKLPEVTGQYASGLHTNAFYAADSTLLTITEHSFNDGVGTITLDGEVAIIGFKAFYKCEKMTAIEIPNTVTHLGKGALEYLYKLTSLTLPEGLIEIGENALYGDTSLVSLTIPASVTTIGKDALFQCFNLTSLVIETDNTQYDSRDNCNAVIETATNTLLFGAGCTTIPATVTTIAEYAFYCAHLTSLVIPASVDSIGGYAFIGCNNLASVTFESNACQNAIGSRAFSGVGSSTPALLTLPNNWTGSKPDEDGSWYGGKFELAGDPTTLPQTRAAVKATKVLTNGQVILRAENKNFSVLGQEVR